MELNFLFWNTNGKKCLTEIYNLVNDNNIDVLILAENDASGAEMLLKLNNPTTLYFPQHPSSLCEKIKIYSKFHYNFLTPITESSRVTVRSLNLPTIDKINLVGLHYGDKGSFNAESQSEMASELKIYIDEFENKETHTRTIIVGDFNMNPFETGLIKANGLHATMSHSLARKNTRKVQSKDYPYFYNPMWSLFGDLRNEIPGTYYYRKAELVNYHWNIFDQVLIRPSLIDNFDKGFLKILTNDGSKNLITRDGFPNKQHYADHLPIRFKLKL